MPRPLRRHGGIGDWRRGGRTALWPAVIPPRDLRVTVDLVLRHLSSVPGPDGSKASLLEGFAEVPAARRHWSANSEGRRLGPVELFRSSDCFREFLL
jgi:hypothetical protein